MNNARALLLALTVEACGGGGAVDNLLATRAKAERFAMRDPITTAHKLAQADAKRARKNAKRLYVPECSICAVMRATIGRERTSAYQCEHGQKRERTSAYQCEHGQTGSFPVGQ